MNFLKNKNNIYFGIKEAQRKLAIRKLVDDGDSSFGADRLEPELSAPSNFSTAIGAE